MLCEIYLQKHAFKILLKDPVPGYHFLTPGTLSLMPLVVSKTRLKTCKVQTT